MSFASLLIDTVTVFNPVESDESDRYGNPLETDPEGTDYAARVQQQEATEDLVDRDTRITLFDLFLPPDAIITALSEVEWGGDRYTVDSEPELLQDRHGPHHIEAVIKRIEG